MTNPYFVTLLSFLASVRCREASDFVKTVPTITNSLVNLGKMEISFYFNGKHPDDLTKPTLPVTNMPITRSHAMEPSCPCSAFKGAKNFPHPSDLITKILKSNDLFKDQTSEHCCDSHEEIHENTIFFEMAPTNPAPMTINNLRNPMKPLFDKFPFPLENLMKRPMQGLKPKAMEIFLFPKRKDIASFDYSKLATKPAIPKSGIQVVGDKEVKLLNESASVKKDLTVLEKKEKGVEEEKIEAVTNTNAL